MTETPLSPLSDDDIDAGAMTDGVPLAADGAAEHDVEGAPIGPDAGATLGETDGVETNAI